MKRGLWRRGGRAISVRGGEFRVGVCQGERREKEGRNKGRSRVICFVVILARQVAVYSFMIMAISIR